MSRAWTAQQQAVLNGFGQMVVSASAGSGKTAVMIEKIKNLLLQGAKIEEVLAVTFTRASAQEMKERLQKALQQAILTTDDRLLQEHLKRELDDIAGAMITTIDSFCNTLVKKNFFRLEGVVPNFSILTEEDDWLHKLQNRAMHLALQEWLAERTSNCAIDDFCKIFAKNGDFGQIQELVLQAYNKVRNRENYLAFIQQMSTFYTAENYTNLLQEHFKNCKQSMQILGEACDKLYQALCAYKEQLSEKFFDYLTNLSNFCKSATNSLQYDALVQLALAFTFERRPSYRAKKEENPLIVQAIKKLSKELEALVDAIKDGHKSILLYQDRERSMQNFLQSGQLTTAFCKLVLLFDSYFTKQKQTAGKLEFIDLAHLANQLLENCEVQTELREQFQYLFVDEYQDTSPIQESILQKLQIENFCMVGDLKQSIYGFRGCTPEIMQQKMQNGERYTLYQLSQNFRSRKSIIDFVNSVFANILPYYEPMVSNLEPECQEGIFSYSYLPKEIEKQDCSKVYSVLDNLTPEIERTPEAELVYAIITDYLTRMREQKALSPEECYRDIVILTRSRDDNMAKIIAFLTEQGIPITTDAEINICSYPEIKELCNILEYIDNRQQDIPLVATLKSALIGMTDEELIAIKQSGAYATFYQACQQYLLHKQDAISEKLAKLEALAVKLQNLAKIKGCSEVLEYLLIDRELELSFLTSGGKNSAKYATNRQKLMRIERLLEAATDCSVSAFLQKVKLNNGRILYKPSGGQDAVQIMTVHQSKGLEFPVVLLVGLEGYLARNEQRDKFKYDANYGFYFDAYHTTEYTKEKTILSRLARDWQVQKAIEDQKRIFYVAMTRAQKELHILRKSKEARQTSYKDFAQFSDFLADTEIEKYDRTAELLVARGAGFLQEQTAEIGQRILTFKELSQEEVAQIGKNYQTTYAHAAACNLPIKSSATALKTLSAQIQTELDESEEHSKERRLFASGETVLAGLAYHAFLENVDFAADREREVDRVLQILPTNYQQVLEREKMLQILQLPLFASLQGATLYREQPFLLHAHADEIAILKSSVADGILLQGIIDLLIIQNDKITIVDYKYSGKNAAALQTEYAHQMQIYKLAVQKWKKTADIDCYLLNIKRGESIKMDI